MPTALQRDAVRYDLDVTAIWMPDAEIDVLYTRAETAYPSNSAAVEAKVRILAVRRIFMGASRRADYIQNESTEKLSQIFDNLKDVLKMFSQDLVDAETDGDLDGSVMYGGLRRKPSRLEELPDDSVYYTNNNDVDVSRSQY